MNRGGYGNDGLMVLAPIGIGIVIAVMLFGGLAEALDAANAVLHEIVHKTVELVTTR
ncbi:MAG TPA: hypothetical protein VKE96_33170 [Vicinamibacterales bacterium]|nr:hypothetical protein [Vicinamibacterales bacterium]